MGEIEDRLNRNMYMLFKQKKHTIFVAVKKGGVLKLVGRAEELLL